MKQVEDKISLSERIKIGLSEHWKIATAILVLIILAMAGILIVDATLQKKHVASSELAEEIQEIFVEWIQEKESEEQAQEEESEEQVQEEESGEQAQEEEFEEQVQEEESGEQAQKEESEEQAQEEESGEQAQKEESGEETEKGESKDQLSDKLTGLINKALADFPRYFAAQKAIFIRARMAYEEEQWESAAKDFEHISTQWPDSYLAPVSLYNASAAWEEADNLDNTKKSLTNLVENYSRISPQVPEALFNLGRIAEGEGDTETALEKYKSVESQSPDSRWAKLAQNRILVIEE